MQTTLLSARHLRCERDERLLFDDLSFELAPGEALRIEGPNGAGKTTLMRVLAGLATLWEGHLQRAEVGFLFVGHEAGLKLALSAEENLRWQCGLHCHRGRDERFSALASLGLGGFEDIPCASLSAGQRRRVALARLLLVPAGVWMLDEPFTSLDASGCELLNGLLGGHLASGGALVFSSHHEMDGLRQHAAVRLNGQESAYVRLDA